MSGVMGSPTPIKLGVPIKIYLFKKYLNIPMVQTTSAMIYELITQSIVLILLAILFGGGRYLLIGKQGVYLLIPIFIIIALMLIGRKNSNQVIYWFKQKIMTLFNELKIIINNGSITAKIFFIQLILQLFIIFRIYFLLHSIGIESLSFMQISSAIMVTILIVLLSMIPGGYGIKELSMVYFLVFEGLDYPDAIFVSLADRTLQVGISMILGIFASFYFTNINRKEELNIVQASK